MSSRFFYHLTFLFYHLYSLDHTKSTLNLQFLNDDFCDCLDGSDEGHTAACSFSSKSIYFCPSKYAGMSNAIPLSRMQDGKWHILLEIILIIVTIIQIFLVSISAIPSFKIFMTIFFSTSIFLITVIVLAFLWRL